MQWIAAASLMAQTTRRSDGRNLMVSVSFTPNAKAGAWVILALESDKEGVQILDSHSHALLPAQDTVHHALALAERYAKWWRSSGAVPFEACACENIAVEPLRVSES